MSKVTDSIGRLHLLTDVTGNPSIPQYTGVYLCRLAWQAGIRTVQLRQKDFNPSHHLSAFETLSKESNPNTQQLIINDYVNLYPQICPSGFHVGVQDTAIEEVIEMLPIELFKGFTVHNQQELERANSLPITYIGIGPIFGTRSKELNLPNLGLKNLKYFCRLSKFPVIAIGSITCENITSVLDAGAYGIAILSDYTNHPQPAQQLERYNKIFFDYGYDI